MPSSSLSRRHFVRNSALLAASTLAFPSLLRSAVSAPPSRRLKLGFVGVGGKGRDAVDALIAHDFVAFCDVDDTRAAPTYSKHPAVPRFKDFRRMLERHGNELDSLVVCTPDHTHFHPVAAALARGLHVFVEKPLGSTIWEGRELLKASRKAGKLTQMGIQGHSMNGLRVLREWIDSGVIGPVQEVFFWTDRPLDRDTHDLEADAPGQAIPKDLDWDLWLGPARERAYSPRYVPQHWRAWWDFGQSALGDIGAHLFDVLEYVMEAGYPTLVTDGQAQRRGAFCTPRWSSCRYEFPARGNRPAFKVHWLSGRKDGKPLVPESIPFWPKGRPILQTGFAFVGTQGTIHVNDMRASARPEVFPEALWLDFKRKLPPQSIPRIKGDHFRDWTNAILENHRPSADFEYSAPLCEITFLGNLAIRLGKDIRWNPETLSAEGLPEAEALIRPPFERKGWEYRI